MNNVIYVHLNIFIFLCFILVWRRFLAMKTELIHQPILPPNFDQLVQSAYEQGIYHRPIDKLIPKNLWIAFFEVPPADKMYKHTQAIINRAKTQNWTIHLMDQDSEDEFMIKYYGNTSIFWAYDSIDSRYKIAASDIWRYAALYAFGGFYLDDDSDFLSSLDECIHPMDSIIVSKESNRYSECYIQSYHLSEVYQNITYGLTSDITLFDDYRLLNWGIFIEPKHPIFLQLMNNIVEILKYDYVRQGVIGPLDPAWPRLKVLCVTGPGVFTATFREVFLLQEKHKTTNYTVRVAGINFESYGGKWKAEGHEPYKSKRRGGSYTYLQQRGMQVNLLSQYQGGLVRTTPQLQPQPQPQHQHQQHQHQQHHKTIIHPKFPKV